MPTNANDRAAYMPLWAPLFAAATAGRALGCETLPAQICIPPSLHNIHNAILSDVCG